MILVESYSKDWIMSHRSRKGFEKIDPQLTEKMIHALGLVELLAAAGLDFVFKGGTSLILLLDNPSRFSIDIDIITLEKREYVEQYLTKICTGQPFKRFELKEKRSYLPGGLPKAHYSLIYNSGITEKEEHILLDILYDEHSYPVLLKLPIKTEWLMTDATVQLINVPAHDAITGDKLTAYAPNTIGVPYGKGKELEIVKQLGDVGRLYHHVKDIGVVKQAFDKTTHKELKYRGNKHQPDDVIEDIIQTGLLIARRGTKEEPHVSNFKEIQRGLLQFKAYQMASFFRINEAIISAAKAALVAARIRANHAGNVEFYSPEMKKTDYLITKPKYIYLNKLSTEALFYWNKTLNI